MKHILDNPIWRALTTAQASWAETFGSARRFIPEFTSLAGFEQPTEQAFADLGHLYQDGETAGIVLETEVALPAGWKLLRAVPMLQMVHDGSAIPSPAHSFETLGADDVPEMVSLAELTKPGPFGSRTREFGTYLGIKHDGKLVAMAGERMRVPGFAEVSAVCTHSEHVGHGYAKSLMVELMRRMRAQGEIPFLHVRKDNDRAVKIYEKLGFGVRLEPVFMVMRKVKQ